MKDKKLFIISHSSAKNGAPLSLCRLVKHSRLPCPVTVIFPSYGPIIADFEKAGCDTLVLSNADEFKKYSFFDSFRLFKLLLTQQPRLLIANSIGSFKAIQAARLLKIPRIFYIHEILDSVDKNKKKAIVNSTKILCASAASAESVSRFLPKGEIEILNPGIEIKDIIENEAGTKLKKEFNIPTDAFLIGTIGTVCPGKGTEHFIKAAKILQDDPRLYFVVVGKIRDKFRNYYDSLLALIAGTKIENRVFFTDERFDINSIINEFDIFVQPSLREAFSIVNMEAMAAGRPIIATRIGGNAEQIEHEKNGLLVNINDPEAIARDIRLLLENPSKGAFLSDNARQKAIRCYDISLSAQKFNSLISGYYNK